MSGIRVGGLIIGSGGGGGGGGTTDHRVLTNRNAANQHPKSAITGLETDLENLGEAVENSLDEAKAYTDEKVGDALDEAKEYADDEIADKVVAGQSWLPAVSAIGDLPSEYGTPADFTDNKTWLCRVRANNNVYQCISGQILPSWELYSENTDFVDEEELATAINKTTQAAPIGEDSDKFVGATAWAFGNWFNAVVAKINGLITGLAGTVKTDGNQTVDGIKVFSNTPSVPTPTNDAHAANKAYVDNAVGGGFLSAVGYGLCRINGNGGDIPAPSGSVYKNRWLKVAKITFSEFGWGATLAFDWFYNQRSNRIGNALGAGVVKFNYSFDDKTISDIVSTLKFGGAPANGGLFLSIDEIEHSLTVWLLHSPGDSDSNTCYCDLRNFMGFTPSNTANLSWSYNFFTNTVFGFGLSDEELMAEIGASFTWDANGQPTDINRKIIPIFYGY